MGLIAEHKLDTTQPGVIRHLHDDIKPIFNVGSFCINAASSQISAQSMYKPGGVLSITCGSSKGRILESGKDTYGRWVYSKLRRNNGPPVVMVVTYQVVDTAPRTSGPTMYATQLYASYIAEGRPDPDHLRYHHANDLINFIKKSQERGEWVIVAGDLNEVLGETTHGLTRLHSECGLVDAASEKHGKTNFTTYQCGTSVSDYRLVDNNIYRCITSVRYEPFISISWVITKASLWICQRRSVSVPRSIHSYHGLSKIYQPNAHTKLLHTLRQNINIFWIITGLKN